MYASASAVAETEEDEERAEQLIAQTEAVYKRKHCYRTEMFQLQDACIAEKENVNEALITHAALTGHAEHGCARRHVIDHGTSLVQRRSAWQEPIYYPLRRGSGGGRGGLVLYLRGTGYRHRHRAVPSCHLRVIKWSNKKVGRKPPCVWSVGDRVTCGHDASSPLSGPRHAHPARASCDAARSIGVARLASSICGHGAEGPPGEGNSCCSARWHWRFHARFLCNGAEGGAV